jgi:hypothetical protein
MKLVKLNYLFSKCLYLFGLIGVFALSTQAAIKTWDGGGADANWNTPANWVGDTAPVANDDLVFPAVAAQFTTNNNFFLLTNFSSITFEGGTYTVSGNLLRLNNGLTVNGGTQTLNTGITLSAAQTFNVAQGATVTLATVALGNFALTVDGAGNLGLGLVSGSGTMVKNGLGAALILASLGYTGAITVNNGIFVVDASIPGSSVTVNSPTVGGGQLGFSGFGGTGTVGAVNVVQGVVSAGTLTSPTGILNIQNGLTISANGNFAPKLGGTTPGANGHDQLNVTGTVNITNSRLAPIPWNNFRPVVGDSFLVINNDGTDPIVGTFASLPEGAVFSGPLGAAFRVSYRGGTGNDLTITRVPRAPYDFDGDGKSEVSTFRPTNGTWNARLSGNNANVTQQFGANGDLIAPADFDGDNKTDYAVFRPSGGIWFILRSSDNTVNITQFGANGDLPVPNDFDGDGRADITVYRQANGGWYQLRSLLNNVFIQQFGANTDKPVMADFDGDGRGDLAVFRTTDGTWHFFQSNTNSYLAFPFGLGTDIPCPGDFDGDGKTDVAVFRASSTAGQPDFYILRSSNFSFFGVEWGTPGDVPVIADYDGDGKSDVGIWRPTTTGWFVLNSNGGVTSINFGQNNDKAVPSAFN